jgi:hypothetical protein
MTDVDSQLLKTRIETRISDGEEEIDQILWDFVHVVYERAYEPCLQDICNRLFRLQSVVMRPSFVRE